LLIKRGVKAIPRKKSAEIVLDFDATDDPLHSQRQAYTHRTVFGLSAPGALQLGAQAAGCFASHGANFPAESQPIATAGSRRSACSGKLLSSKREKLAAEHPHEREPSSASEFGSSEVSEGLLSAQSKAPDSEGALVDLCTLREALAAFYLSVTQRLCDLLDLAVLGCEIGQCRLPVNYAPPSARSGRAFARLPAPILF
jgi:hypothetical protein